MDIIVERFEATPILYMRKKLIVERGERGEIFNFNVSI